MLRICSATIVTLIATAPAIAQHQNHSDHSIPNPAAEESAADHGEMDHAKMDHGAIDHSDHAAVPAANMASLESGPANAADAIWGADAMRASRKAIYANHGNMEMFWIQGDRLEYRARQGSGGYLWDLQGFYGGDLDKFWFKSEGEGSFGEAIEDAEIQALYSRAIAPFFDLQAGIRQDLTGPSRTHAVVGLQGHAPYMLEIDAAAFLSNKGDLTARIEAEYDQRLTQRLILQPRLEASLSAQDMPELGVGSGIDHIEVGLRLRYEIAREFAPYVGVEQEWKLGGSRNFARLAGEDPSVTNYVIGLRFWF
ncbi:MAG: copper resistance protein B [Sphingorhabdus sp.]